MIRRLLNRLPEAIVMITIASGLFFNPQTATSAEPQSNTTDKTQNTKTDKNSRYMLLADSATRFMEKEQWEDARRCLIEALKLNPASPVNPMLFSNLGICQSNIGDYASALQSYEIALIRQPNSTSILLNRARTHLMQSKEKEALRDLDKILEVDSTRIEARRLRSTLRMKQGDYAGALKDITNLSTVLPEDPWLHAAKGQCLATMGDNEAASREFTEALKHEPDVETMLAAIMYYLTTDDYQNAEETIFQALKQFPREGGLYLMRAVLHKKRFQNEEAEIDKKIAAKYGVDCQIIDSYFPSDPPMKREIP